MNERSMEMNEKRAFEKPKLEIIRFQTGDVIATSVYDLLGALELPLDET